MRIGTTRFMTVKDLNEFIQVDARVMIRIWSTGEMLYQGISLSVPYSLLYTRVVCIHIDERVLVIDVEENEDENSN